MFEVLFDQAKEWLRVLTDFDGTHASVNANFAALQKMAPLAAKWPADLQAKQRALLTQGLGAKSKLDALKATRDKVVGWLKAVIPGSSTVGILPVIWVGAGITAFVVALEVARTFLVGSASFAKQLTAYQAEQARLVQQGMDPTKAAEVARQTTRDLANSSDRPGLLETLGSKAIYIGGAVVLLVWLGPKVLDHLSRSRR